MNNTENTPENVTEAPQTQTAQQPPNPSQYLLIVTEIGMARLKATFGNTPDIDYLPVRGFEVGNASDLLLLATQKNRSASAESV